MSFSIITHSKPWITANDRRIVDQTIKSGLIAQGKLVKEFEENMATYLGIKNSVAFSSGTAALVAALRSLEIKSNQEVILPSYVCKSVLEAVRSSGGKPVLCDVGNHWNMTVDAVTPKITKNTAAIIVVHIFGIPANTHDFKQLGFPIIEDCAQAFGAKINSSYVGTLGTIGIFSFHATKCLTTGEGGLVTSPDPSIISKVRTLRDGNNSKLKSRIPAPMTDIQAALGISQLARYDEFLKRRKRVANQYFKRLKSCSIMLPESISESSIFFRFPIRVKGDFEELRKSFNRYGIQVRRGVDMLLHRYINTTDSYPMAEKLFNETLSLPIYPAIIKDDLKKIISAARLILGT